MSNKIIVGIDVEDWYHGPSVISYPNKPLQDILKKTDIERGYKYIDMCLEILASYNIKATFFWVAEYAQRNPALLKKVSDAGHEIACHGLEHYSKLDSQTKQLKFTEQEFKERTRKAKQILEDISGQKVIGYRAPNAYISGNMIDWLEELDFKYDSSVSVNSIYNKTDSKLVGVTTAPYYPLKGTLDFGIEKRKIIEYPWPYYNFANYKIQSAGGPFLRLFGSGLITRGINESLENGHTVFYFHPIDICNEDIPMDFSIKRPIMWYFKGDLVKRRIKKIFSLYHSDMTNFRQVIES